MNVKSSAGLGRRRALPHAVAALVAVFYLVAAIGSATRKASTLDETAHLGAGIAYWKTGDFRMNPEHPPLVKLLAGGVALLAVPIRFETSREEDKAAFRFWTEGWQYHFGNYLLYHRNDADRILFWGRLAPILFGLLGGWAAWWWGRRLGGPWCGAAAAAFLLLYPEYMGHARWVTFDVPTATVCMLCAAALWSWWRRPCLGRAGLFVVAAILAAFTKLAAGMFLAFLGFSALLALLLQRLGDARSRMGGRRGGETVAKAGDAPARESLAGASTRGSLRPFHRRRGLVPLAALYTAAVVAIWAVSWVVYGFRFAYLAPDQPGLPSPDPYASYSQGEPEREGIKRWTRLAWERRLAPEGFLAVFNHSGGFKLRRAYLLGEIKRDGFLTYFFWTMLLKTPLLYLALGATAAALGLWRWLRDRRGGAAAGGVAGDVVGGAENNAADRVESEGVSRRIGRLADGGVSATGGSALRRRWERAAALFWCLPFLFLLVLVVWSRVNIGHRHILFLYMPWCVALGLLVGRWLGSPVRGLRWLGAACLAGALLVNVFAYPHYATYFNEVIGSPLRGCAILRDSNVDWGQDIKAAGEFARRHEIEKVNLAYFGSAGPEYYGITNYNQILPSYPYAVNVNDFAPLDPSIPSVVGVNNIETVRGLYPGRFDREPEVVLNSMVIFGPSVAADKPVATSLP